MLYIDSVAPEVHVLYAYEARRKVMEDQNRPCLYHVAGPCFHPACLEAHTRTILEKYNGPDKQE